MSVIPSDYREQEGCRTCSLGIIFREVTGHDYHFCNADKVPPPYWDGQQPSHERSRLQNKWEESHSVEPWGICDQHVTGEPKDMYAE